MKKLVQNQAVRYIFFGGCTTAVNLIAYYFLCMAGINVTAANTAAVLLAIVFAYVVNKLFVFEHRTASLSGLLAEAGSFFGMRLGTMVLEVLGVVCLVCIWGVPNMASKLVIQAAVLVCNYLISRFVVFKDKDAADAPEPCRGRRYFFAGFALSALAAGAGFVLLGVWPFGDKTLLIIDSLHQYLPFYTVFHEKLADSESFLYSFSGGLGFNFWSTYAYYLASPLNFLMAFIPTENVCDFMDLMILLKIALCGGCFSWYMHQRDPEQNYLPAVFGMMFGLSNFVIGYYFNLMWLDSVAMLPLMMCGIERIVRGEKGKIFGLALFYGLWCNYYIGFMLCLFACLYFLVCWIGQTARVKGGFWKALGKSCLSFGWYALLAGGMAALVLIPAFAGLTASESMEGNTFPTTIRFYEGLEALLENHMAFLEPVTISSSQVGLNIYCGMASVPLAILYLFDRKVRLRERLAHFGLCALLLFSFACNIPNYIWHGFHVQNGLPNRFAFLYIAVILVMAYEALRHLKSFWIVEILFAAAVPAAFLVYRLLEPEQEIEDWIFYASIGLVLLYLGLFLIRRYAQRMKASVFSAILSLVIVVEVTANAIYGISENGSVTRSIYLADQSSYQTMMAAQNESGDSFFRSEVDRQRMRNVTMYAGGNAMVMFNSTMQSSVTDFCDSLGIEARTNKNGYLGVTKLMNDVLGIRYLASPSKLASTMYQFTRVAEDGELALYKNNNALSVGFMVKDSILDWNIHMEEPLDVQNSFVTLATGLDPIFVLDRTIDMVDGENYGIKIPENKQVYLCIDTRVEEIVLNTPEYTRTYTDFTDHLYVINGAGENNLADFTVQLKETQTTVQAEVYTCSNEAYQQVIDRLSESQLQNVKADGNRLTGDIHVTEEGTLLLTIPYDEGWKVLVDGRETAVSCIGDTLMGVHLTEGDHTIEMKYTPQGLWAGSAVSFVCVILLLLTFAWEKRHASWFAAAQARGSEPEEENPAPSGTGTADIGAEE